MKKKSHITIQFLLSETFVRTIYITSSLIRKRIPEESNKQAVHPVPTLPLRLISKKSETNPFLSPGHTHRNPEPVKTRLNLARVLANKDGSRCPVLGR